MKDDRLLSGNQEDDREGDPTSEDCCPPMWLRDYKSGMEYEVYSLALHVAEESPLWGLTFSRWGASKTEGVIRCSVQACRLSLACFFSV